AERWGKMDLIEINGRSLQAFETGTQSLREKAVRARAKLGSRQILGRYDCRCAVRDFAETPLGVAALVLCRGVEKSYAGLQADLKCIRFCCGAIGAPEEIYDLVLTP